MLVKAEFTKFRFGLCFHHYQSLGIQLYKWWLCWAKLAEALLGILTLGFIFADWGLRVAIGLSRYRHKKWQSLQTKSTTKTT